MHLIFQARKTGKILHRISLDEENGSQNDLLLREFSMQVHHGCFVVTANGFFEINLDLLGSV